MNNGVSSALERHRGWVKGTYTYHWPALEAKLQVQFDAKSYRTKLSASYELLIVAKVPEK
jgi:hypothetical protein